MNTVTILLSTYNGKSYLKIQLNSLNTQMYKKLQIIARDDISTDNTQEILKSNNINILKSEKNLGAKKSFSALLEHSIDNTSSDYFMFCDQDDVWEQDKIENTMLKMQDMERSYPDTPILVHTDLKVVDDDLKILDDSFWNYEHINPELNSLNRLLLQNTITGCTVMINRKLAQLALPISKESIMHDWWLGLVASKFGKIGFINESTIQYRQHSSNDTGAKKFNFKYIVKKAFRLFFNDKLYSNISQAKEFLDRFRNKLDHDTILMLEDFINIENKSFYQKRKILLKYKLLKQGLVRNIGLFLRI